MPTLEGTNKTGQVQIMHHHEHGWMMRRRGKRLFLKCTMDEIHSVGVGNYTHVLESDVLQSCIKTTGRRAGKNITCSKCGLNFPKSEIDDGVCRDCLIGYTLKDELASLDVSNAIPVGGICQDIL